MVVKELMATALVTVLHSLTIHQAPGSRHLLNVLLSSVCPAPSRPAHWSQGPPRPALISQDVEGVQEAVEED